MVNWSYVVNALLPIPLIALFFLSIPLPNSIKTNFRNFILKCLDTVIFMKVYKVLTVYVLATATSTVMFLLTANDTYRAAIKQKDAVRIHRPDIDQLKCHRWRLERNFWISAMSLILWIILYRVRTLIGEIQEEKRTKLQLEVLMKQFEKKIKESR